MHPEIQVIWKDLAQELYAFTLSKVKDKDASKDIVQDIFLKAHLNIHKLRDLSKLNSWMYQIARNTIYDYFRANKPSVEIENIELAIENEPSYKNLVNCINSKIEQLPHKYQEALVLTTFKNLQQKELATYLGISYSGTKSRVQRAKEKLKVFVANCENVETDRQNNIIEHNLDE